MSRRMFDESFRKMAVELSYTKGSVKEVADELGVSQTLLNKWRQRESDSSQGVAGLTEVAGSIANVHALFVCGKAKRIKKNAFYTIIQTKYLAFL